MNIGKSRNLCHIRDNTFFIELLLLLRELFWTLLDNHFNVYISSYIHNLDEFEQTCVILGKRPTYLNDEKYWTLPVIYICARTWQILSRENELEFWV